MQESNNTANSKRHWEDIYAARPDTALSWYQQTPETSLTLINNAGVTKDAAIIDVGGGSARLAGLLLENGYRDITVLDIAANALALARENIGKELALSVTWIIADITQWRPQCAYDLWHDRAVFHFLTQEADRAAYKRVLLQGLIPGGHLVIGTFGLEGPDRCSGLPVRRYSVESLTAEFGSNFKLRESLTKDHCTPAGKLQQFQFCRFIRVNGITQAD